MSAHQPLLAIRSSRKAGQPAIIGEADEAIWAKLAPVQGFSAQAEALEALRNKTAELDGVSAFMPRLMGGLASHWERFRAR